MLVSQHTKKKQTKGANMYLRISLLVALLGSVASLATIQFVYRPKVQALIEERNRFERNRNESGRHMDELAGQLGEMSRKLVHAEAQLEASAQRLAAVTAENEVLREGNLHLEEKVAGLSSELSMGRQQLAQLAAVAVTPEQAAELCKANEVLKEHLAIREKENDVLARELQRLRIRYTIGCTFPEEPELPPVDGKVVAVDPKWGFMVLDKGANAGLLTGGVLMISRDSRLVGKARLTRVEADRSIADVLPGWQFAEVREGDRAIH
jgi:regulator of replication initiation timing